MEIVYVNRTSQGRSSEPRVGRLCVIIGSKEEEKHHWRDPKLEAKSHHQRFTNEGNGGSREWRESGVNTVENRAGS